MKYTSTRLQFLFELYLNDKATAQEEDELWDYVNDPVYAADLELLLVDAYKKDRQEKGMTAIQKDLVLQKIFRNEEVTEQKRSIRLWPRIVSIASAVALIVVAVYFFSYHKRTVTEDRHLIAQDVKPGRVGATLTLANGKKIRLANVANGELAKEAGISISKMADGQIVYEIKDQAETDVNKINILTTAKGETYRVRLPDGSLVALNAASSLTYSAALNESEVRRVKLDGEAYFEVSSDKDHPFIVKTAQQEVQVLGTHFNISSYQEDNSTKTTLLEGSVKVRPIAGKEVILKPDQQAELTHGQLHVKKIEAEDAIAWKNGYFIFNYESLDEIMRKISRWYNVRIVFEDAELRKKLFIGTISRFENVSGVLNMLSRTGVASFKLEDKTITINKKR